MEIYVYECFSSSESKFMGTLFVDITKRKEHYSFEYSDAWLKETKFSYQLDPDLFLYSGRQFSSQNEFGVFADSCPDRWGRALINRRERIQADREKRKPRELHTLAIQSASYYNLKEQEATSYAKEIVHIVNSNWEKIATNYGLTRQSIEFMRPAFSLGLNV